jgi:hypothetical protein
MEAPQFSKGMWRIFDLFSGSAYIFGHQNFFNAGISFAKVLNARLSREGYYAHYGRDLYLRIYDEREVNTASIKSDKPAMLTPELRIKKIERDLIAAKAQYKALCSSLLRPFKKKEINCAQRKIRFLEEVLRAEKNLTPALKSVEKMIAESQDMSELGHATLDIHAELKATQLQIDPHAPTSWQLRDLYPAYYAVDNSHFMGLLNLRLHDKICYLHGEKLDIFVIPQSPSHTPRPR